MISFLSLVMKICPHTSLLLIKLTQQLGQVIYLAHMYITYTLERLSFF